MIQTVFASYFSSVPDPLPNNNYRKHVSRTKDGIFWNNDDYSSLLPLINSVIQNKSKIIIFHDCFENTPIIDGCSWIKVQYNTRYSPTIYRWFVYYDHLKQNKYENLFMVDSTDVVMLRNMNVTNEVLYCGTEYKSKFLSIFDLKKKKEHINVSDFRAIFIMYKNHILLNGGIIGGSYDVCYDFLEKNTQYHSQTSQNIEISLDAPIINYTLLKHFKDKLSYGCHVNTKFLDYEYNEVSTWQHK